jgi:hypothetical protein
MHRAGIASDKAGRESYEAQSRQNWSPEVIHSPNISGWPVIVVV